MSLSRKVLRAISLLSGVQVVGIVCSVVRAKFISLWIGAAGVGLFAIFNNVLTMVSTAAQLNLRQSAVRDISAAPLSRQPSMAAAVRWWAARLGLAGGVLMLLLSPLLSLVSFSDTGMWWAFALLSVAVVALSVASGEQAVLQGSGRLGRLARSTMQAAVTATCISLPLYYWLGQGSIIPSILVFAGATLVFTLKAKDIPSAPNTKAENVRQGRDFLRLGMYLTVSSVATTAASYALVSYLNRACGQTSVGIYQAGYTLVIQYTGIIFTALAMEYYPRMAMVADRARMASTVLSHETMLVLYVLTPLLVVFVAADQLAIWLLYSSEFEAALPFVTIGIGAMVPRAVSYCMAYVIIGRGDGRVYIVTELLSTVVGLTLNILGFHFRGFYGLGCSYVVWYLVYTLITAVVCHRYGIRLSRSAWTVSGTSAAMVAASIILKPLGWWAPLSLLLPACALTYSGLRKMRVLKQQTGNRK